MNSISQNSTRYLPHELKTRIHAVETYRNGNSISYVCRKYHISRVSLWRWNKKFDGTLQSLMDHSHKPLSPYPNAHTNQEILWIENLIRRNPHITLCELWIKLKRQKNYKRYIGNLYRILVKMGLYKRCIQYYGYNPKEIQTDYGTEFTFNQEKIKVLHPMEQFCLQHQIKHHKIRPRTPRHNDKVERSHRNDNERFYSFLSFYSLKDLLNQGKRYLKRPNQIPMQVLNYLSPLEMRQKLLQN